MISEIILDDVACYKSPVTLPINKENTLVYGLNGSGKSTISNYLYDPSDEKYSACQINKSSDIDLMVYNQKFVEDFFYEDDSLKGVFTLSKENKEIKSKISQNEKELKSKNDELIKKRNEKKGYEDTYLENRSEFVNKIWEIKQTFAGGDRVLEFCLAGLQKKEKLYDYIQSIKYSEESAKIKIEDLKKGASIASDNSATVLPLYSEIDLPDLGNEQLLHLGKEIKGSTDGPVANFISELNNSDWVKRGLQFVDTPNTENTECPFCQERTISEALLSSIKSVFDDKYEKDLSILNQIKEIYSQNVEMLDLPSLETSNFLAEKDKKLWKISSDRLSSLLSENLRKVRYKIENPAKKIEVGNFKNILKELNEIISSVNKRIDEYNRGITNRDKTLQGIKANFWLKMRHQYSQTLESVNTVKKTYDEKVKTIDAVTKEIEDKIQSINKRIVELREQTVNIDSAIQSINSRLSDLGANGFEIRKHNESMYKLVRSGESENVFNTLSEGEKTLISFLYFIERCHGVFDPTAPINPKVIVIDDPISSLSHIYVFNICQYIKREFVKNESYDQTIIFTHSLYFFYELTFTKKPDRDEKQSLFRLIKNEKGTSVKQMRYEEIQNDYQTYWSVIKDPTHRPALVANCMRSVIEYFFNFVQKTDFNNVFQMQILADDKFKSFNRYMNRESHSLGQNIFDIKEFDYEIFIEGLKNVFESCGYIEHFKSMMK